MEYTKRQHEIMEAGIALIADSGIQGMTMKKIAQKLNITEPAVYRHFKNKFEIICSMITQFDFDGVAEISPESGFEGLEMFIRSRIAQSIDNPKLAKVMFAEELFMDDPEFTALMLQMMHRHKEIIENCIKAARQNGEMRSDIPCDMAFRIILGAVRMLIKQWCMSNQSFDLKAKGDELINSIRTIMK